MNKQKINQNAPFARGGSLFFLPAWMFGALWIVLGIVYTLQQ